MRLAYTSLWSLLMASQGVQKPAKWDSYPVSSPRSLSVVPGGERKIKFHVIPSFSIQRVRKKYE